MFYNIFFSKLLSLCSLLFALCSPLLAQKNNFVYDTTLYNKMRWREIGPFRGGRSIAVAGHKDYPNTFYFGATGGGIWKSEDGGTTWLNCSDGFLKVGIVGALAIAESDPNVIYAGTGEACIRGNVMPGEGMYKSDDAGKTWKFTGLAEAQTISKIVVHPKDENLVYVAAFGHVFGANKERGVFRSNDGGKNWQKILFKNDSTGAVDIEIDPNNARIIYAALWQAYRNPWSMSSGGGGSSLWKSTNGGDTWEEISSSKGLPKGLKGKIGIAVSQAKRDRVWAIVEADEGGLFRSEDGGKNWTKINDDRRIRQRAWYYSHIYADPKNADVVYILNVQFFKSMDGGKTLQNISVPHGDNHDLWINPNEPRIMVNGNDGGACVTYNGGQSWTELDIATAQIYHVSVDSAFPYNIYGAQQDNSTIRIASRTTSFGIGTRDWYSVGGGESGFVVPNWSNPEVVYAGSYDGYLTKYDHRIDQEQNISPYPENPMGSGAKDWKYRFQWTFPILVSKYDAKVLYVTANKVFKSTNEGMSWEIISPDLTRNDTTKLDASGGPITKDNTSVEYYGTIFAFAESKAQKGILWSGSDDGLIFVSQDDGKNWNNVTPKDLPEWSMISILDASTFENGTAYVAANRYKLDDFKPYIFKTNDFGKSWKKIVRGIPDNEFVHVVREDQNRKGLLYAGTERGMYVSFDDGEHWQTLQLNLPVVPIHDIAIQAREKDLVVATHGRSFWVLDNLTPLYQLNDDVAKSDVYLYQPRFTYPIGGGGFDRPGSTVGKNPPRGVVCYYYFKNKISEKDTVKLEFLDERDSLIKSFVCKKESESKEGSNDEETAPLDSGMNRFVWDMQYKNATDVPGAIMWGGTTQGPVAIPGKYFVRLKWNAKSWKQEFEIWKDPRVTTTQDEFKEQLDFLLKIRDTVSAAHECVNAIRDIRSQVNDLVKRMEKHKMKDSISSLAKKLNEKMKKIEEEIIQVKIKSGQDALNYPIKLNDKIASLTGVVSAADAKPTKQAYDVYNDLTSRLNEQLHKFKSVIDTDLVEFNRVVKELEIPAVIMKK